MRSAALAAAVLASLVVLFAPPSTGDQAFPHADKVVHVALFALLTAAAVWRAGRTRAVAAALVGYALASEAVQGLLLPERQADPRDVLADLAGVVAVWVVVRALPGPARRSPAGVRSAAPGSRET